MALSFPDTVERWPLARLIPHARNARIHTEDQVAQIAGSIAEFGFVNPVLVGDDGVIVAGHGRVLAARKLGLADAPLIVLSHLTPTQRRHGPVRGPDHRLPDALRVGHRALGASSASVDGGDDQPDGRMGRSTGH